MVVAARALCSCLGGGGAWGCGRVGGGASHRGALGGGGASAETPAAGRTRPTACAPRAVDGYVIMHAPASQPPPGGRAADMDDILIVTSRHSQAATLWINYLTKCFNSICQSRQKPPYKILNLGVEDIVGTGNMSVAMEEKMVRVKLQIVILCPQFLEHIYDNPAPASILTRLLQPDRVLAMLLGVEESNITEQHQAVLPSYQQWQRMQVKDQDESFVGDFLGAGLTILARVSRQQLAKEKALFSIVPKKVNEGQNKVILLLNEPMTKDDVVKIKVNKNGEFIDVIGAKRRNPYTLYFQIPECCLEVSMLVSIHVEKNGQDLGNRLIKCESRMRELDQLLRTSNNPLDFMCQTLGFSPGDREHLDNFLVTSFQRNLPPHFNLLQTPGDCHQHRTHASPEEYPTLLHFAARFGLEKFAWQLLECPGGTLACEIRNVCDLTPAEMAEAANHPKLAHILRGYMQMTEFTIMYDMLGKMSEGNPKNDSSNYRIPRRLSDTYQIPQSTRTLVDIYDQVPSVVRPITPPPASPKPPTNESEGYMEMLPRNPGSSNNSTKNFGSQNLAPVMFELSETLSVKSSPSEATQKISSQCNLDQISLESAHDEKLLQTGVNIKKSTEHVSQGVQDELLEIINDFKNNVHTLSEVERLVENWKNRNDVQRSFKEKQEQLNQMREQYQVLQQQMKSQMKRPTPFDRIRKIFRGKPKAEQKDSSSENSCTNTPEGNNKQVHPECGTGCTRPMSSLSIHSISSSSSGRMSTLSGCSGTSMGDSGTHSDTDDRKAPFCPVELTKTVGAMPNYAIPPAPRVVMSFTSPMESCITKIENRPPEPVPRPESDPYISPEETPSYMNTGETPRKQSIWSETEERISVMISANSTNTEVVNQDQNKRISEPEYLEALPINNSEYVNISYSTETTSKTEQSQSEQNDATDSMPEYMNVTVGNISAPPVPPRGMF
ncbi:hypothetical protein R5R35_005736 [Gryllus longicercus]|uniref:DBB domain-containing protein n=1 Tax=Gryllus longicercus TaxID=2509291 RepID=A0AAN9VYD2_9ORTH